jgi:PIN domain nuclease of toxin-antitoxin system
MRVLIDTQIFLWGLLEPERLRQGVKDFLKNTLENEMYFSHVSSWEIATKYGIKKLDIPDIPERYVPNRVKEAGFLHLPIKLEHVLQVHGLPPVHKDPFDRLLVSQARVEGLTILTSDPHFAKYKINVLNVFDFKIKN